MPNYELIYIVNPNVNEDILPEVINKIGEIVIKAGGKVTEVIPWGRKRLAYPIRRYSEGNYILAKIETEASSVKKIDSSLKMFEDVLRHLVIRTDN